jgi:hypothetical protein
METLSELILRRKTQLGLSFRQLAGKAKDGGAEVKPNWNHLVNRELREFPRLRTLHTLATALEVTPEEVLAAAAVSLGYRVTTLDAAGHPGDRWMAVSHDVLTEDDERAVGKAIARNRARPSGRRPT